MANIEPNLYQDYLDSNPANISKEGRQHIADKLKISIGEVNKLIERFSKNWTKDLPEGDLLR